MVKPESVCHSVLLNSMLYRSTLCKTQCDIVRDTKFQCDKISV